MGSKPQMNTDGPYAAGCAATTVDGQLHCRGLPFSLSQRERAGVRESASKLRCLQPTQSHPVRRAILPLPLSLSRWEKESAGGLPLRSSPFLRGVASLSCRPGKQRGPCGRVTESYSSVIGIDPSQILSGRKSVFIHLHLWFPWCRAHDRSCRFDQALR